MGCVRVRHGRQGEVEWGKVRQGLIEVGGNWWEMVKKGGAGWYRAGMENVPFNKGQNLFSTLTLPTSYLGIHTHTQQINTFFFFFYLSST